MDSHKSTNLSMMLGFPFPSFSNPALNRGSAAGAELTTYTGASPSHGNFGGASSCKFFRTSSNGVVGTKYNQIGLASFDTEDWNLAVYDDNAGTPNNLLAQTGDVTISAGDTLNYKVVTEFTLTTAVVWLAAFSQNAANNPYYKTGLAFNRKNQSGLTYPTYPNPASAGADIDDAAIKMGIRFV